MGGRAPHRGKGQGDQGGGMGALWRGNWEGNYHLKGKQIKLLIKRIIYSCFIHISALFACYHANFHYHVIPNA